MRKIVLVLMFLVVGLFAKVDFQSATKDELLSIKGIGIKKATSIIEYRKTNKIKSIDDLKNIKGFGKKLLMKIKESQM